MCFFHGLSTDPITRVDAIIRLAALGAMPILPSINPAPRIRESNANREYTVITGSTSLVGSDLTPLHDSTILIRSNKIEAVGPTGSVAIPDSAFRVHVPATFTIPGLIDSHVHFFQSGGLYTRPDVIDLRSVRPYTDEVQWVRSNLQDTFARYLRAGITSVVDVGGPFWNYDVRELARRTLASPRVMVAGPLISSVERSVLDPYNDPPIVKIDTIEAARKLIDRELAARTDFVKFWWIVTPTHPAIAFAPVARAAIDYAHERGARIVIHATELETARLAVESGTDILAHSVFDTDVDDAFIELLRSRNVIYCPTLIVIGNYGYTLHAMPNVTAVDLRIANPDIVGTLFNMRDVEGVLPAAKLAQIRALRAPQPPYAAMRNLRRIHEAGIRIATGTDAGNIGTQHASSMYGEMMQMAASGLSPKDVLLATTRGGAEMMGRLHEIGTIAVGKFADLVVLKENPLHNVRAIASIDRVIKDGHVFEAESILREKPELIVQRQVNAYNCHDANVFAETYAADAKIAHTGQATIESRPAIQEAYRDFFIANPQLRSEILSRDVSGETIVDKQHVTGFSGRDDVDATATYRTRDGLIARADISA